MVQQALAKTGFGMVEQTTILGSTMNRSDFRDHYALHSLAWLAPEAKPPSLSDFRYYNSGVVLGHRQEFIEFSNWALAVLNRFLATIPLETI
jgi:glycine betaine/choline ABC-type transport system substrate-binding protein